MTVGVGILGCGNVGGALVHLLTRENDSIAERTGITFDVRRIAVRSPAKDRGLDIPAGLLTDDALSVITDPGVDIVVELMGGIEPARGLIAKALEMGKPVITANKELMANVGGELTTLADKIGVDLLYEAAVAGGIPIIRPLRESLAGEEIHRIMGIVNGTTNFILTRMTEDGVDYSVALGEAQSLGYAERDPTADVEGFDAAAKATVIANVAFGAQIVAGDVYSEGISTVTPEDIALAGRLGYVVKLLAVVERGPKNNVGVRVHPTMVPVDHPLASVRLSFNAIFIEGESVGELMFYGRGAGGGPTASAVLGDLIDAAHNLKTGSAGRLPQADRTSLWPIDEQSSPFYINLEVADQPGVLAVVAGIFGKHEVSIRSVEQQISSKAKSVNGNGNGEARLIFITHNALESAIRATLYDLRTLDVVGRIGNVMRVIER